MKLQQKLSATQEPVKQNLGLQITVQCSPLGEAEAIGDIPKTHKSHKKRGQPIDVYAPEKSEMNTEQWQRIAELACFEDEI